MSDFREAILTEMHHAATGLLDLLEQEQQAYADHRPMSIDRASDLDALSQRKLALVKQLETLEKQRTSAADDGGLDHHPQWRATRDTLAKCQRLNDLVGANIVAQANYTQRAMAILSGGSSGEATLYSAEGRASSPQASRALGQA